MLSLQLSITSHRLTASYQYHRPIAFLKMSSTRSAQQSATDAVQIFGGRAVTQSGMGRFVEHAHRTAPFDALLGGGKPVCFPVNNQNIDHDNDASQLKMSLPILVLDKRCEACPRMLVYRVEQVLFLPFLRLWCHGGTVQYDLPTSNFIPVPTSLLTSRCFKMPLYSCGSCISNLYPFPNHYKKHCEHGGFVLLVVNALTKKVCTLMRCH